METNVYPYKNALPNKRLDDNGNIKTISGNSVLTSVPEYENAISLPNKFLNPDGTYSTLNEILADVVDTDLFVPVETLPETGDPKKIYLVPNGKGTFDEYHYDDVLNKWDPFGVLDISNLVTTEQLTATLAEAKAYVDQEISKIVPLVPMSEYSSINKAGTTKEFITSISQLDLPVGTMLLGTCNLTDVTDFGPEGTNMTAEEIKVEIFEGCIQLTMTSTNVPPYEWRLSGNSTSDATDWRPSVTQDYVNNQIDSKITQTLGGEY